MRLFINAVDGYRDRMREQWEQTRLISFYSAFPHVKGLKLKDILIPGEVKGSPSKQSQEKKEEAYKLLEKWKSK